MTQGNGIMTERLSPSEQRIVHAVTLAIREELDLVFAKIDELTDEVEAALDDDEPDEDDVDDHGFETRKRRR